MSYEITFILSILEVPVYFINEELDNFLQRIQEDYTLTNEYDL